jgi:hypothetical protein
MSDVTASGRSSCPRFRASTCARRPSSNSSTTRWARRSTCSGSSTSCSSAGPACPTRTQAARPAPAHLIRWLAGWRPRLRRPSRGHRVEESTAGQGASLPPLAAAKSVTVGRLTWRASGRFPRHNPTRRSSARSRCSEARHGVVPPPHTESTARWHRNGRRLPGRRRRPPGMLGAGGTPPAHNRGSRTCASAVGHSASPHPLAGDHARPRLPRRGIRRARRP